MPWPTWHLPSLALAVASTLALAGCGADSGEDPSTATAAVPAKDYPASKVCGLLPLATVTQVLPGARIDTSLPTPDSCFYAADDGDVILTAVAARGGADAPTARDAYDAALSDATNNGARDVRPAASLGEHGQIAVNEADGEIAAVWRRGDAVYDLQYSSFTGLAERAAATAEQLAKAVQPLP